MRAAHGLVQRRNLVVESVAALVETAQVLRHGFLDKFAVDRDKACRMRRRAHLLKQVEQTPGIAVGQTDQPLAGSGVEAQIGQRLRAGAVEQLAQFGLVE